MGPVGGGLYKKLDKWTYIAATGKPHSIKPYRNWERSWQPGNGRRMGAAVDAGLWRRCLNAASQSLKAFDEYRLLRNGRNALDRRQFRIAVSDAGIAVELALTRVLEEQIGNAALAEGGFGQIPHARRSNCPCSTLEDSLAAGSRRGTSETTKLCNPKI